MIYFFIHLFIYLFIDLFIDLFICLFNHLLSHLFYFIYYFYLSISPLSLSLPHSLPRYLSSSFSLSPIVSSHSDATCIGHWSSTEHDRFRNQIYHDSVRDYRRSQTSHASFRWWYNFHNILYISISHLNNLILFFVNFKWLIFYISYFFHSFTYFVFSSSFYCFVSRPVPSDFFIVYFFTFLFFYFFIFLFFYFFIFLFFYLFIFLSFYFFSFFFNL